MPTTDDQNVKQIKTYIQGIVDFPVADPWSVEGSFIKTLICTELCNSGKKPPKHEISFSNITFYWGFPTFELYISQGRKYERC